MDLHTWDLPLTAIVLLLVINELIRRLMTARQHHRGENPGHATRVDLQQVWISLDKLHAQVSLIGERCASLEARVTGLEHTRHP